MAGDEAGPRATVVGRSPAQAGASGDLNDDLISTSIWSDGMLAAAGIPVVDAPVVSVGGGLGSFVLVDFLRIAGVPTESIRVLTGNEVPWKTYQYLTRASQIPVQERLRSDSSSSPDNIWGFPGYALREAWNEKALAPLWNVLTEPILCDYYTPRAGHVFRGMQKEADRIRYWETVVNGQVRMVRRRQGGGYFTILTPPAGASATKRVAYRSRFVHLCVGYPGLKFLPDLQAYREKHRDYVRVVNAYEPHEHVYEELLRHPSTVLIRGGGIVASRVLQRIIDDREQKGAQTTIVHLLRTYVGGAHGPSVFMRRKGSHGWAYQGFNWPKGCWGGQLKARLAKLEGEDRKQFFELLGGTTTPIRRYWREQLARGRATGFYQLQVGVVEEVRPGDDGTVVTSIRQGNNRLEIRAAFVIDCTGLEADIREHRVLADLLDHSGAGRNPLGRLDVERTFEVRGTRSEPGRMYAAGSSTLGGYYAVVDSFLGLQYSALQMADDLARQGFCARIGVARSISQWWKWALNKRI